MGYIPQTTQSIIESIAARVIARTNLTDLTEGSVLMQIITSVAEEIVLSELRLKNIRDTFFPDTTSGADLDERAAEFPSGGIARRLATNATCLVTVTRENTTVPGSGQPTYKDELVVPAGAIFGRVDDPSQKYRTESPLTFAGSVGGAAGVGFLEDIPVIAMSSGVAGNCDAGTITKIVDAHKEIIAVTNTTTAENGQSQESDSGLRSRMYTYIASLARCQPPALESRALSYQDGSGRTIAYAKLWEDPWREGVSELIIDDGTGLVGLTSPGGAVSGLVPHSGPYVVLYHEGPATEPIPWVEFGVAPNKVALYHHLGDFISLHERGVVLVPRARLEALGVVGGTAWSICSGLVGEYTVYTGIVASLQRDLEGSTSNPGSRPGWRAAGTRVLVRPATKEVVNMQAHIVPHQGIALPDAAADVIRAINGFFRTLGPGETAYLAQLIEWVMGNAPLISVTFYTDQAGALVPMSDVTPSGTDGYRKVLRTDAEHLIIIPAQGT